MNSTLTKYKSSNLDGKCFSENLLEILLQIKNKNGIQSWNESWVNRLYQNGESNHLIHLSVKLLSSSDITIRHLITIDYPPKLVIVKIKFSDEIYGEIFAKYESAHYNRLITKPKHLKKILFN